MDFLSLGKQALATYQKSDTLPVCPDMSSHDFDVWLSIFREYPSAWCHITKEKNLSLALDSYTKYQSSNYSDSVLHRAASLAQTNIEKHSDQRDVQYEVVLVWLGVFHDSLYEFTESILETNTIYQDYFKEDGKKIASILKQALYDYVSKNYIPITDDRLITLLQRLQSDNI